MDDNIFDETAKQKPKIEKETMEIGLIVKGFENQRIDKERSNRICQKERRQKRKQREIRSIKSYFKINSLDEFLEIIIYVKEVLELNYSGLENILSRYMVRSQVLRYRQISGYKTTCSKLVVCFSGKWKEEQSQLILYVEEYTFQNNERRFRVMVFNKQGILIIILVNIKNLGKEGEIVKYINSNYTKITSIIITFIPIQEKHQPSYPNQPIPLHLKLIIQGFQSIQINVIAIQLNNQNETSRNLSFQNCMGINLEVINNQHYIIFATDNFNSSSTLSVLSQINTINDYLCKVIFSKYNSNSCDFNQKEIMLRLYAYCFNFCSLNKKHYMSKSNQSQEGQGSSVHQEIAHSIVSEFAKDEEESLTLENIDQRHFYKALDVSTICPVCSKKSKYACISCSKVYHKNFGLCVVDCWREFHQNTDTYLPKLKLKGLKKKVKKDQSDEEEVEQRSSDQEEDVQSEFFSKEQSQYQIQQFSSASEVIESWKLMFSKSQKIIDQFALNAKYGMVSERNFLIGTYIPTQMNMMKREQMIFAKPETNELLKKQHDCV